MWLHQHLLEEAVWWCGAASPSLKKKRFVFIGINQHLYWQDVIYQRPPPEFDGGGNGTTCNCKFNKPLLYFSWLSGALQILECFAKIEYLLYNLTRLHCGCVWLIFCDTRPTKVCQKDLVQLVIRTVLQLFMNELNKVWVSSFCFIFLLTYFLL